MFYSFVTYLSYFFSHSLIINRKKEGGSMVVAHIVWMIIALIVHFFALMRLFPLVISVPFLFLSFFSFFTYLNNRHRFRGFH
ncbi:Uncharacterized conserved protein [Anoxybacillus flavithermus WK1]|uniref:Uncharacterized conserved protein n=2 Tax=Anoxybacillus flavithermus TaxID=33934 RepID=B7GLL1_ANOFW|nr:Uncharacterized conserved protein [Anoxybacillus flavithermus WK1]